MTKLRIHNFSISLDGYGAGPNQSLDDPLGVGADNLHDWVIATRTWQMIHGSKGGRAGIDDKFMTRGTVNVGAWIMGRNMFGPVRGPWPDESWRGWWATDPPFQTPVFVLTHHARGPIALEGGTTFYFVTDGMEAALTRANDAANGKDVLVGGGVATIRQYLQSKLIEGLDLRALGYCCTEHVPTKSVTHVVLTRKLP